MINWLHISQVIEGALAHLGQKPSQTTDARLGPFEILNALGAGGMGEVYRARDTKLNRDVALKILPESVTHDPERIARFRREAQVLAALNHPHIGAIYGLDEANGQQFLALELIDGETLASRLKRGALPLDEALAIAKQIAEVLEAAHQQGIIHRDLKPANIALTKSRHVKLLDFGLALVRTIPWYRSARAVWAKSPARGTSATPISSNPKAAYSGGRGGTR